MDELIVAVTGDSDADGSDAENCGVVRLTDE